MDTGLLALLTMDCESAQLENLVAIELARRYGSGNVFYFESNVEVDFFIPDENLAIQVSLEALDQIGTRERELGALAKLKKHIPDATCLLITSSEEDETEYEGTHISVLPAWKWLLSR